MTLMNSIDKADPTNPRAPIAIVFALREEVLPLLKESSVESRILEKTASLTLASFRGVPLIFCQTGVGMANAHEATEILLRRSKPAIIISTGCCGSTQQDLIPGDLILASEILSETPTDCFKTDEAGTDGIEKMIREEDLPYRKGPLLTVWSMAGSSKKKEVGLRGSLGLEMETAAVAAIASKETVPFVSLRAVFDPMDEEIPCKEPFDENHPISFLLKNPGMILKIPTYARWSRLCQTRLTKILSRFIDCYGRSPSETFPTEK